MPFHDVLFPEDVSQGVKATPRYSTSVVTTGTGHERRNRNWDRPRLTFDVSHVLRNPARRLELLTFFRARGGAWASFRFKDWSDYFVGMTFVDGQLSHAGSPMGFGVGNGVQTTFQLTRTYPDPVAPDVRPIHAPDPGAFRVYVNGVRVTSGYTLDPLTGMVLFASAPASGATLAWSGKFWIVARLESDEMMMLLETPVAGEWQNIRVVEVFGEG